MKLVVAEKRANPKRGRLRSSSDRMDAENLSPQLPFAYNMELGKNGHGKEGYWSRG